MNILPIILAFLLIPFHAQQHKKDTVVYSEKIDSSLVTARMSIISHSGDTLVLNTGSIKNLENDRLRDLLAKLPGVTIRDNTISIMGEPVKKILLNGKLVFGENVHAPLDLILADAVKEIQSFREHDRTRMIESDTLGFKQRVMNVRTNHGEDSIWELA